MRRFEALDSWRGLCALLVVVFHLNQDINWRLLDAGFIRHFDLFVDFFFVLSGFVIATSYEDRLKQGYGVTPFVLRRFGRIYPLHLAMLVAMLGFAVLRVLFPLQAFNPRDIFDGGIYDFTAIFTNLLLLQGIGFENHLTWNFPSWSISAEFYTYLIFALIWAAGTTLSRPIIIALALICPILLYWLHSPSLSPLTLVRCVYGFALGVLVLHLYRRIGPEPALLHTGFIATAAELGALALCGAFIVLGNGEPWLAPLVFALVVLVFAFEAGPIGQALRAPPFRALGTLSYSIYMIHAVVIFVAWRCVTLAERFLGWQLTSPNPHNPADRMWGTTPEAGDFTMAGILVLVVALSALSYKLIEKPGREWGRQASLRWREGGWAAVWRSFIPSRQRPAPSPALEHQPPHDH